MRGTGKAGNEKREGLRAKKQKERNTANGELETTLADATQGHGNYDYY